ncbi:hypothetical protein Cni_G07146 [Canna indica]|uniref:Uncharacterized protein n=1 Tax=Canna indica TaxID=4628 RepID=A0AAQ3JXZ2_9LILI|nr:hypothetical protein Cni_G07146 [Canna indica]
MDEAAAEGWEYVAAESQHGEEENATVPPSLHEDFHLHPSPGVELSASASRHERKEERVSMPWWSVGSAKRSIRSGLEMVCSRIQKLRRWGGGGRGGWSIAAIVGLIGILMYQRRRHQGEKELLLIINKGKDRKISQLLHQISLMNEMIAARCAVPILRRL